MSDIVTLVGELAAVRGQRDALIVENERLRGLLREALTGETRGDWMMRVREAIGD